MTLRNKLIAAVVGVALVSFAGGWFAGRAYLKSEIRAGLKQATENMREALKPSPEQQEKLERMREARDKARAKKGS